MAGTIDKRAFIEQVRSDNLRIFGADERVRASTRTMLANNLTYPWMYVHELTQNACDAGAQRLYWRSNGDSVLFQHDGYVELDEDHVKSISLPGSSQKGFAKIGFMGIGFKSVFSCFRRASISGSGWRFGFQVGTREMAFDGAVPEWIDTLLPVWDEGVPEPDEGYTTAFLLEQPTEKKWSVQDDFDRIAPFDDLVPLAILALRGLKQVRVNDVVWDLSVNDGIVEIHCSGHHKTGRWKYFTSYYRPTIEAMRQLAEVREETGSKVEHGVEREVVALLPLNEDGLPIPQEHSRVFATLPTQTRTPFGFHLQADWLVSMDRQNLRLVDDSPWQEDILQQVPDLVQQLLLWLTRESDEVRRRGYAVLCNPDEDDGLLAASFGRLRQRFQDALNEFEVVPIQGISQRCFRTPQVVALLPGRFQSNFGRTSDWRPDVLFGHDLMDRGLLGSRGVAFASWLGWGTELEACDVNWDETLPKWWAVLPPKEQFNALFALWDGIGVHEWNDAPVVPTDDDQWIPAVRTKWLNEAAPANSQRGGEEVAVALANVLPGAGERVPSDLRHRVIQMGETIETGVQWFKEHRQEINLAGLVRQACLTAENQDDFPFVKLLEWALGRGHNRKDLVPLVLTDMGAVEPREALLADPLIGDVSYRRALFTDLPALVPEYASIAERQAVVTFLEGLGVRGGGELVSSEQHVHFEEDVADLINAEEVEPANKDRYKIVDFEFPFDPMTVPLSALQAWLSRECFALQDKGRLRAESHYHYPRITRGRALTTWVKMLQEIPWVLCTDGKRRRPVDVLLESNLDFEGAAIAEISMDLSDVLQNEGVQFEVNVPKSAVLHRLVRRGSTDMPDSDLADLIKEAVEEVDAGRVSRDDLQNALRKIKLRGSTPLTRVVERTSPGTGLRSDLSGFVIALHHLDDSLSEELKKLDLYLPSTTTGHHALGFLRSIWEKQPERVDDLRKHLATAYRYVLEDIDSNAELASEWRTVKPDMRFYGKEGWQAFGPNLAVEDIQSVFFRRLLPSDWVVVSSTHLGDSIDQIRRVAGALGLKLLSDELNIRSGRRVSAPIGVANSLQRLINVLSALEGRDSLAGIEFHRSLVMEVGDAEHEIRACIDDSILRLVGSPADFAEEAADQFVEYFRLGHHGNAAVWLAGALFNLGDTVRFEERLQVLAEGIGVDISEWNHPTDDDHVEVQFDGKQSEGLDSHPSPMVEEHRHGSGSRELVNEIPQTTSQIEIDSSGTTNPSVWRQRHSQEGSPDHVGGVGTKTKRDTWREISRSESGKHATPVEKNEGRGGAATSYPTERVADHFGIRVVRRGGTEQKSDPKISGTGLGGPVSDDRSREAVMRYEKHYKRKVKAMPAQYPGFDIESTDVRTGLCRRIEVKGVKGILDETTSVILTFRQIRDAVSNEDHGVEYWLYIVDSTGTDRPRVFPIPWIRYRSAIRYGFYAREWVRNAHYPAVVAVDGTVTPLPS